MEERYWELFCTTGAPVFYLLYRSAQEQAQEAKTAWCDEQAELV